MSEAKPKLDLNEHVVQMFLAHLDYNIHNAPSVNDIQSWKRAKENVLAAFNIEPEIVCVNPHEKIYRGCTNMCKFYERCLAKPKSQK